MLERKTLNEDLFYKGSSANLPRLHTCENKTPFWDKSKFFASHYLQFWVQNCDAKFYKFLPLWLSMKQSDMDFYRLFSHCDSCHGKSSRFGIVFMDVLPYLKLWYHLWYCIQLKKPKKPFDSKILHKKFF